MVNANDLLGTWKMKSYVVTTPAGVRTTPFGENPTGYLSYSADGRMQVIGAADGRIVPADPTVADPERVTLYNTMFAYAGRYSVEAEAGTVIHHIDISWNEAWTGTDQIRLLELTGNTLTLSTHATDAHYLVVWEKVIGPR